MRNFWLIIFSFGFLNSIQAQYARIYQSILRPQLKEFYLTTHPKNDFDPAVSQDGRWLVFVSDRSGNRDLWVKSTKGGQAFQITTHKAADYSPCWAPDNRTVYFISTRSDAEGDLWKIEFKPEKLPDTDLELKQVDTYLGYDNDPVCSPDGRFIAITTTRLSGNRNIWIVEPETENIVPFTFNGGESPSWSSDGKWIVYSNFLNSGEEPQSDLFIKYFSSEDIFSGFGLGTKSIQITDSKQQETFPVLQKVDGIYSLFFLRYEFDTNGDNHVNVEDFPVLISADLDSITLDSLNSILKTNLPVEPYHFTNEKHLNSVEKYTLHPFVKNDELFFSSLDNDQYDIVKIPVQGSVPLFNVAEDQFAWADSVFNLELLRQLDLDQDSIFIQAKKKYEKRFFSKRLLAFLSVRERFPQNKPWSIKAGLEVARELIRSGEKLKAFQLYRKLLGEVPIEDSLQVQIKLDLWRARDFEVEQIDSSAQKLLTLFQAKPAILSKIQLFLAEQYVEQKDHNKALTYTKKIIELNSLINATYFNALKLQAEIFLEFGSPETAIDQYLQILKNSKSNYWQQLSCAEIIDILLSDQQNQNQAVLIQNAIQKYASQPLLAAELHLWLGEHFWQNQNPRLALRELDFIIQHYQNQKIANLKAGIIAASIYIKNQQHDEAILIYQQILKRLDLSFIEKVFFKKQIWKLQYEHAEQWRRENDFQVAYNLYRQLVAENPKSLEAQRGLISCAYELDKLSGLEQEYKHLLKQNPDNEFLLYSLGLIYSFKFEDNVKGIVQSNEYLEKALQQNPQLVYGYLTLSFNYERLELFQRRYLERKRSWIIKASRTLFAPVIWLYRTVTLRKAAKFQNWYEQAIELLQLAISINDEKRFPKLEALLYFNLANNYYQMGEFGHEKAYEYYQKKTRLDSTFSGIDQEAIFYHHLGHSAISVEDWQTAKNSLSRAISLHHKLGNGEQIQMIKKLLALSYQLSGDYETAIETFQSTLPEDKNRADQRGILETYRNIAYNYLLLEDAEEVRQYCLRAFEILNKKNLKKLQRPSTAIRFEFLGYSIPLWSLGNLGPSAARSLYGFSSEDERALIYTILAQNAANQKDLYKALNLMKAKLAVFRKLDDVMGRAIVENNIGMIHSTLGNHKEAWNWFRSSFTTCRKENLLSGEIINVLNMSQLFLIFKQSKTTLPNDYQILLTWLKQTIEKIDQFPYSYQSERVDLFHQNALLKFSFLKKELPSDSLSKSSLNLPVFLKYNSEFAELIDQFEKAADLARQNAFFRKQAIIWKNLGELFQFMDLLPEARQYYNKALSLAKDYDFTDLEWRLLAALGNLMLDNNVSSDSLRLDNFNQARQIVLNETIFYPKKSTKLLPKIDRDNVYFNLIENYCDQRNFNQALLLTEEYQSLQKLNQLHQVEFSFSSEFRKLQAGNYLYYTQEINRLEKRVGEIKRSRRGGYRLFYQVIDSLAILKSEFDDFVLDMKKNDPELLSLFRPLDFTINDLQTQIKDNQGLLRFFSDNNNLYSWCLTSDSLSFHKTDISQINLPVLVDQFKRSVQFDSLFADSTAQFFYDIFLQPFENHFDKKDELIFVGETPFLNIPFDILKHGKTWLAEQFLIYSFPTLTDFYLSFYSRRLPGNKLSWLGNASELIAENRLKDLQISQINFSTLTESTFRSELNQADYLVVNRPLVFIKKPVLQSYFHLQPPRTGKTQNQSLISPFPEEQDGIVQLADLFEQSSKALFALLLYPEDSLTTFIPGGSVIQTAWRNAGIPAYITLRWPVSLKVKNEFVKHFLSNITENRLINAFSFARNELKKKYKNPAIWAAFVWRGFPGLATEEKEQFSRDQFVSTVSRGQQLETQGFYRDALFHYSSAKKMAMELRDSSSVIKLDEMILLAANEGMLFHEAIDAQNRLIKFYQLKNKTEELIPAYNNLFYFYTQLNDPRNALQNKKHYNELLLKQGEIQARAHSTREMGILYEQNEKNNEALDSYLQAMALYSQLKNDRQIAFLHLDIGRVKMNKFDLYQEAIDHFTTAKQIFSGSDEKVGLAISLQNLGLAYEKLGMYLKSFDFQTRALAVARNTKSQQTIGLNFQYLANLYWKSGEYLPALNESKKALDIFEKLQNGQFLAMSHSTSGLIYNSLGDSALAIDHLEKAYNYTKESNNLLDQATVLKNLGLVYSHFDQFEKSLEHFYSALELDSLLSSQRGKAYDFRNIGMIFLRQKKFQEAESWLKNAKNLSSAISDRRNFILSLVALGNLCLEQKNIDSSFVYFFQADSLSTQFGLENLQWQAQSGLGDCFFENEDFEEASVHYNAAKNIIEQTRQQIQIENYQAGFLTDKMVVYDKLIECFYQLNQPEMALNISEQARGRHLVDLLSGVSPVFTAQQDSNRIVREKMLQDSLNAVQSEIILTEQPAKIDSLKQELKSKRDRLVAIWNEIKLDNKELGNILSAQIVSLDSLRPFLSDSVALILYHITEKQLYSFFVTKYDVRLKKIQVEQLKLEQLVQKVRDNLKSGVTTDDELKELTNYLWGPLKDLVDNINQLVFIPHKMLHYFPFTAIKIDDDHFLLDEFTVSNSPTLTALFYCLQKGDDFARTKGLIKNVLAVGNPDLQNPMLNLPFAEKEIVSVQREFSDVTTFVEEEATETNVVKNISKADLILFSCHGEYSPENPLFSALLFTKDSLRDGRLEAWEIFQLQMSPFLVAMSACETGLSKILTGDDVVGLNRSLIYAGAPAIVSSLWKVDDLTTAVLMKRFFRLLKRGYSRSSALRQAQLYIRNNVEVNPLYWAAFGLTGDFR